MRRCAPALICAACAGTGSMSPARHFIQVDVLDAAIAKIDREADVSIAAFRSAVEHVRSVSGVKDLGAR